MVKMQSTKVRTFKETLSHHSNFSKGCTSCNKKKNLKETNITKENIIPSQYNNEQNVDMSDTLLQITNFVENLSKDVEKLKKNPNTIISEGTMLKTFHMGIEESSFKKEEKIRGYKTLLSNGISILINDDGSFVINEDGVYQFVISGSFNIIDREGDFTPEMELSLNSESQSLEIKRVEDVSDYANYFSEIYITEVKTGDKFILKNKTGVSKDTLLKFHKSETPLNIHIIKLS